MAACIINGADDAALRMPSIKSRLAPPGGEPRRFAQLIVRHPHYDEFNTLLSLPALSDGDTVDYDTALTICGIICDNSYSSGWFARSRGGSRICDPGAPLKAGEVYYFAAVDPACNCFPAGVIFCSD
jgi:hypothetical protein